MKELWRFGEDYQHAKKFTYRNLLIRPGLRERFDQSRIELATGATFEFSQGSILALSFAVRSIGRHSLIGVSHGDSLYT